MRLLKPKPFDSEHPMKDVDGSEPQFKIMENMEGDICLPPLLHLTKDEKERATSWVVQRLVTNPTNRLLADILYCQVQGLTLDGVPSYHQYIAEQRADRLRVDKANRQRFEWDIFLKNGSFRVQDYSVQLTTGNPDVAITIQPNFAVKFSNGKQSAIARFSAGSLDQWRRKVIEEIQKFKATYGSQPDQLIVDPEGMEITLVRDARETMRPIKTIEDGRIGIEPDLKIGDVLAPVTVPLQLLVKKQA